jgi:hypothetical protein
MPSRSRTARRCAVVLAATTATVASAFALGPSSTTHAVGSADGTVTETLVTTNPGVGGNARIVVTVTNAGPDPIPEAIVPGGAPTGATLDSVTPSQGACAKGRNSVYTCNFGLLPAGASARATVSVTLGQAGPVTAQASLQTLGVSDPDFTNNVARLTFDVGAGPVDVQLNGSASTRSPSPGTTFDYRFQVRVSGKSPAGATTLGIDLPDAVTLVGLGSTSPLAACTTTATHTLCDFGTMPGGSNATVTVTVVAPAGVGTDLTARAAVHHGEADPKPDNDVVVLAATTR